MQVSVTFLCWWCLKWRPRPRAAAASARQKAAQVLCCLPRVPHPHKDCEFTKLISQQKDDEQPQPALTAGLRAMKSRDATSSQSRGCPWAPAAMLRGNERMTFLLMKCSFAQGTILLLLFIIYALLKVCMMLYSAIKKNDRCPVPPDAAPLPKCCKGATDGASSPSATMPRFISGSLVLQGVLLRPRSRLGSGC